MPVNCQQGSTRYRNVVNKVGQYVHDHIGEPIRLDDLAAYTGFSKYHFNRIFAAATGYQLGEFIQRRRLEFALRVLQQGNRNITDIALGVGYDSPSSFTRAFTKVFGVTPTEVLHNKAPHNERGGRLAPRFRAAQMLVPELIELPERIVPGLSGEGFSEQSFSSTASRLYKQLLEKSENMSFEERGAVGVALDNPWAGEQTQSRFFAGFLQGLDHCMGELETFVWEKGTWARFVHSGTHNSLWQTVSRVYADWVIPNNISLKDARVVQRYLNNPRTTESEKLETELYFALDEEDWKEEG